MRRLRALGLLLAVGTAGALVGAAPARAQTPPACANQGAAFSGVCFGPATLYEFTLKGFRFRRQSDQVFVSVASTSQTFNAASVNVGAQVGAYISGATLAPSTYDAVSPLLSTTWRVQGSTGSSGGPTCFTKSSGFGLAAPAEARTVVMTSLPPGTDATISADGTTLTFTDTTPTGLPLTVTGTETITVNVAFDPSFGTLYTFAVGVCTDASLGPILVTMTITSS